MGVKLLSMFTDFGKGFMAGVVIAAILFGIVVGFMYRHYKGKELIRYVEMQVEIQELREDYVSRDAVEFLDLPGVRYAADGAAEEFNRKLDEILQRFRSRIAD